MASDPAADLDGVAEERIGQPFRLDGGYFRAAILAASSDLPASQSARRMPASQRPIAPVQTLGRAAAFRVQRSTFRILMVRPAYAGAKQRGKRKYGRKGASQFCAISHNGRNSFL